MDDLPCTKCIRTVGPKTFVRADGGRLLYYVCKCGQRFVAMKFKGLPPQVIHAGPQAKKTGPRSPAVVCYNCGGKTKQSTGDYYPSPRAFREGAEGAYHWRRHECKLCGPTHSHQYLDGRVEVTKRLRSKNARDIF